jgi:hypothetical protein
LRKQTTSFSLLLLIFDADHDLNGYPPAADLHTHPIKFAIRQGWTDKNAQLNKKFTDMMESGKKKFYISFEKDINKIKPAKTKGKKKE